MKMKLFKQRFCLRKLKVGLASVAILLALGQVARVSADEVSTPAGGDLSSVGITSSPIDEATKSIQADLDQPVVNESVAKSGDVIDVSTTVSPVTVTDSKEGDQLVHTETATVEVTKTQIAENTDGTVPAPTTTSSENTVTGIDGNGNPYSQYERVTKTTTITYTSEPPTVTKTVGTADIVFVVDRSGSMGSYINTVRDNVNAFARNITSKGIVARFGLATYSDEVYGRRVGDRSEETLLTPFGTSYFTSDPSELEKALSAVKIAYGEDSPETATPALNQIISLYDWSRSSHTKKFIVLLTDARIKEDPSVPTIADTLAALNAAGIERTVATARRVLRDGYYEEFASEGRVFDLRNNLAQTLTDDTAKWIVETVVEGRRFKVTKDTYAFYLERRTTQNSDAVVPTAVTYHLQEEPVTPLTTTAPATLPQTGSSDSASFSLLGLGMLLAGVGLGLGSNKTKRED